VDGGGLRRLHDDDRIWLRRLDAPVELDAERAAGARDEEDVLPLARELDEAVGDGRLDALGVVRGAIAVEDRAHGLAARAGGARVLGVLLALIRRAEQIARVDPGLEAERISVSGAVVRRHI